MFRHINCSINSNGSQLPKSTTLALAGWDDSGNPWRVSGHMDLDGRLQWDLPSEVPGGVGFNYSVIAPGCSPYQGRAVTPLLDEPNAELPYSIELVEGTNPFRKTPPKPTRAQVCGVNITFQGLTIHTAQFGNQPWFELAYQCLQASEDRAWVRQQKKIAGDTHFIIEFFTQPNQKIYDEPGQWLAPLTSLVGESNPLDFKSFVMELINDNCTPIVVFDGDNADNPVDGYPNALRQLPVLTTLLKDIADRVLFARLWDGVFYGSTPENIQNFGTQFRKFLPNGYLAIEHDPGHIPVGHGIDDWKPGGMMQDYDVLLSEFADESTPYAGNDTMWQVVGRCIKPYRRPSDQPAGDDPNPQLYLVDTPRGPRFYCAFEFNTTWGAYSWVRQQVAASDVALHRKYFKDLGCPYVG